MQNCFPGAGYKKICFFLVFFLFIFHISYSQNKFTISGYVKDSLTGETLIGATLQMGAGGGVNSNAYGFYSITLNVGEHAVSCSFVGYESKQFVVQLSANKTFNFLLPPKISTSQEVVVYGRRRDENVKNTQMGRFDLSVSKVKALPVLLGEVDILKTLQLLPGIRNAGR